MKIEVFKGKDGQWYVRVVGANGKTVTITEGYANKANAKRSARMMRFKTLFAKIVVAE